MDIKILIILASLTLVAASLPAGSHAEERTYILEIPRQPIRDTLNELSKQTGLQVVFFPRDAAATALMLGPLSGTYTVESALTALLENSGLAFRVVNKGTVSVLAVDPEQSHALDQM